jgi:hypothetical protein
MPTPNRRSWSGDWNVEREDRVDQVADRGEAAAADGLAGDDREEDLDQVQPGSRGRGEVHGDPGVLCQPGGHPRVFVGGVVVGHDVQRHPWVGLGDLFEAAQELIGSVPQVAGVGDHPGGHYECGEQGGGAVPAVVVGGLLRQPGPDGQDRCGPVQRLDLGLLVHAQQGLAAGPSAVHGVDVTPSRSPSAKGGPIPWPRLTELCLADSDRSQSRIQMDRRSAAVPTSPTYPPVPPIISAS